jgi:hypothetical protein
MYIKTGKARQGKEKSRKGIKEYKGNMKKNAKKYHLPISP